MTEFLRDSAEAARLAHNQEVGGSSPSPASITDAPHVSRYFARVDAHLPTLADDAARLAFLKREDAKWIDRFEAWALRVDTGQPTDPDIHVNDFHATLAGLAERARRHQPQGVAA